MEGMKRVLVCLLTIRAASGVSNPQTLSSRFDGDLLDGAKWAEVSRVESSGPGPGRWSCPEPGWLASPFPP